jgi:CshA-type fibril repeat protein
VQLNTTDQLTGIACGATTCPSFTVITGSTDANIEILKPDMSFTALSGSHNSVTGKYNVTFSVVNNGTAAMIPGTPLVIDFYCNDGSGNPTGSALATYTQAVNIAIGNTHTDNFMFTAANCANGLVAVISKGNNCICSTNKAPLDPNTVPIANADYATTPENTPVDLSILSNDIDLDGILDPATIDLDPSTPGIDLTYTVAGQGTFVVNPGTGIVTFTPAMNFNGPVTPIIYQVCDNGTPLPSQCDTAYIYIIVTPAVPIVTINPPTCYAAGTATISNYNPSFTYTFTPATSGISIGASGLISGMTVGTSYTITAGVASHTSAPSATFSIMAVLSAPLLVLNPPSQSICSGGFATVNVSGNNGATVNWTSNLAGHTGTGTTFNTGILTNVGLSPMPVVIMATAETGTCIDKVTTVVTVMPEPRVLPSVQKVDACFYEIPHVTLTSVLPGTTINWQLIKISDNSIVSSGSGTDSINLFSSGIPVGNYMLKYTGIRLGCSSTERNIPVTIN